MRNFGFTLAEVLITLGIIGVVAAMTLPSLINNYKKQETSSRLKKFYSMMSQAILFSENDNGPSLDWDKKAMSLDENNNINVAEQSKLASEYFNKYIKPYIKYTKIDKNPKEYQDENGQAHLIEVYLSDGSTFYFNNGDCAHIVYDTNGHKQPNKAGRDRFSFLICPAIYRTSHCLSQNQKLCPWGYGSIDDREQARTRCINSPSLCASLIMKDCFEFKKDYPHKL